jgi:hypothetical protein
VSFRLKTDPNGLVQYGLIAEEVAEVCPELVTRDDAGEIQSVRYEELAPLLLKRRKSKRLMQRRTKSRHSSSTVWHPGDARQAASQGGTRRTALNRDNLAMVTLERTANGGR